MAAGFHVAYPLAGVQGKKSPSFPRRKRNSSKTFPFVRNATRQDIGMSPMYCEFTKPPNFPVREIPLKKRLDKPGVF